MTHLLKNNLIIVNICKEKEKELSYLLQENTKLLEKLSKMIYFYSKIKFSELNL